MHWLAILLRSAWNRRLTLGLAVLSIALSVLLLLGVERLQQAARDSFTQSVSGTDLVVGPRASPVQLLLYAVFRLGEPTDDMSWNSYRQLAQHPAVAWTIPLALGDSHHGFAVLGTDGNYFRHFRYGDKQPLAFAAGQPFNAIFDAVIGAEVASSLGYKLGDKIVLSHGSGHVELHEHDDKPFRVVGILRRTGTPVDRSVHVGLAAIEAIHLDWQGGAPLPGFSIPAQYVQKFNLTPKHLTAALVGLKNRGGVFRMQRFVNGYRDEALSAVLPGVALDQLWQLLATAENVLRAISLLVLVTGCCGMIAVLLASLNERRRELAILRSVGAGAGTLLSLLLAEGALVMLAGCVLGVLCLWALSLGAGPQIAAHFGILLPGTPLTLAEVRWLGWVIAGGAAASLLPGWRAYRLSLADGLTPRV